MPGWRMGEPERPISAKDVRRAAAESWLRSQRRRDELEGGGGGARQGTGRSARTAAKPKPKPAPPRIAATPSAGRRLRRPHRLGIAKVLALVLVAAAGVVGLLATRDEIEKTLREAVTLPLRHDDIIRQQAKDKGVRPELIAAVIYVESRFRDQTSNAGARGLMQITPTTAKEIEKLSGGQNFLYEDLADPDLNIRYGTFYLAHLLRMFDGNEVAALAAYNAGPTNVVTWGGSSLTPEDIKFEETRNYVEDVLSKRDEYRSNYKSELGIKKKQTG